MSRKSKNLPKPKTDLNPFVDRPYQFFIVFYNILVLITTFSLAFCTIIATLGKEEARVTPASAKAAGHQRATCKERQSHWHRAAGQVCKQIRNAKRNLWD